MALLPLRLTCPIRLTTPLTPPDRPKSRRYHNPRALSLTSMLATPCDTRNTHKSPLALTLLRNLGLSDSRRLTGNTGAVLLAPLSTSHALTRCYVCSHRHTAGQQPQHRGRPPRTNSLLPAAMQRGWSKQQGAAAACARLIGNGQTLACLLVCVCCCLTIGELAWHCIGAACRLPAPARKISFGPARSSRWLPASRTGVRNTEAVANSSLLQRSSRVARRSSSSSVPAASPAA